MTSLRILPLIVTSFLLAACSGGGGSSGDSGANGSGGSTGTPGSPTPNPPAPATGTVGLFLTDKPSDEFAQININVTEAVLIGDDGQESIFQGSKKINLLDLTNYNEPLIFDEVLAGSYSKIRLYIDELQLVPKDRSANIYPKLPANGKIDLLDQGGFEIVANQTVIVEIDLDANKSIKITETGRSRKYNFRPVVKVDVRTGDLPDKLARFDGIVTELSLQPANSFVVCVEGMLDNCADVRTDANTSFFDENGQPSSYSALMVNDPAVVIGRYELEPKVLLRADVVEAGGSAEQINGKAVSKPVNGEFLLLRDNGTEVRVEIQKGTRFFDATGEISPDSLRVGYDLEIEGVFPAQVNNGQPAWFRAALIFFESEDDQQLSGTIISPLDAGKRSFGLSTSSGDTCARVNNGATILLVTTTTAEIIAGAFADLEVGQSVEVFGSIASDSCIDAHEVIVDVD